MAEQPLTEPVLTDNALRTLRARYLVRDAEGNIQETPGELFARVARHVAAAERRYGGEAAAGQMAERFRAVMVAGEFLPNSPTLMNAGRRLGMLSACFVLPIHDSVEDIFEAVKQAAIVQKAGGGTGFSFDRLRPTGDMVASSGGRTSGPISFWRVFCQATRAIQQGAFRRGANMGMMSIHHPDILKFITAKDSPEEFENFNISVKIDDAFMAQLRRDGSIPHVVVNPRTGREYHLPRSLDIARYSLDDLLLAGQGAAGDVYDCRSVWERIVSGAWATGEPGVCFIDRVNADNPTPALGAIEATNPCGEQPLLNYEACNLGSIDLSKYVADGALDEQRFREMIRLAVRFLDDVIDVNDYVFPQITEICHGNRKIGLGVMGLADAMFLLGIKYDSDAGIAFGRRVAEVLTQEAFDASTALAEERGCFPNWPESTWAARGRKMRNAAVTTIAPTGTLSILAGCSGGIEPVFALAFHRRVLDQEMLETSAPFKRWAQQRGFWSDQLATRLAGGEQLSDIAGIDEQTRALFVTAHQVAPVWHVRMQAAFQDFIDGAIAKTINLPAAASTADVEKVYQLAYDLRCKGVTVYRDLCRAGQPMATGPEAQTCPRCHAPMDDIAGCSRCPRCGSPLCAV
ncbi:MAG: adenosylcobalamin-dependent ribonucleoside-diphosphate reductase [Phycisphaerae bacterium]|nr:adenosylcobalamin-dependent ribonucleoside-diphosphate reductase [Phycisphaerae bacterium]